MCASLAEWVEPWRTGGGTGQCFPLSPLSLSNLVMPFCCCLDGPGRVPRSASPAQFPRPPLETTPQEARTGHARNGPAAAAAGLPGPQKREDVGLRNRVLWRCCHILRDCPSQMEGEGEGEGCT